MILKITKLALWFEVLHLWSEAAHPRHIAALQQPVSAPQSEVPSFYCLGLYLNHLESRQGPISQLTFLSS